MAVDTGCLVIADISGYTSYLTGVELEHSHDVLADLLDTIVGQAEGVLTLAKLEGDAIFWYGHGQADAQALLPTLEAIYVMFRRRVRSITQQTTCECNACRRIPDLDLKIIAHFGEYVLRRIAGASELVGSDVIVVHRLLKNKITDTTGLRGYAFLTDPFVEHCGLDAGGLLAHVEDYDDVGRVGGRVPDLERRWSDAEAGRLAYVSEDDAAETMPFHVQAPPAAIWDYLTNPRKRPLWSKGVKRVDREDPNAIPGIGTTNHCVHGASASHEEILDWKPFDYYTWSTRMPVGRFPHDVRAARGSRRRDGCHVAHGPTGHAGSTDRRHHDPQGPQGSRRGDADARATHRRGR